MGAIFMKLGLAPAIRNIFIIFLLSGSDPDNQLFFKVY